MYVERDREREGVCRNIESVYVERVLGRKVACGRKVAPF